MVHGPVARPGPRQGLLHNRLTRSGSRGIAVGFTRSRPRAWRKITQASARASGQASRASSREVAPVQPKGLPGAPGQKSSTFSRKPRTPFCSKIGIRHRFAACPPPGGPSAPRSPPGSLARARPTANRTQPLVSEGRSWQPPRPETFRRDHQPLPAPADRVAGVPEVRKPSEAGPYKPCRIRHAMSTTIDRNPHARAKSPSSIVKMRSARPAGAHATIGRCPCRARARPGFLLRRGLPLSSHS